MGGRRLLLIGAAVLFAGAPVFAAGQKSDTHSAKSQTPKAAAVHPSGATITYRKIFKASSPEFVEIKVNRSGAGTYDIRQLDDTPRPEPFRISTALAGKIFLLARAMRDFNGIKLEARRRIANLGVKTFRYDRDGQSYQVSFNYTLNSDANDLLSIFEGLSLQDQYIEQLRSSMRYDPLGLNDVLVRLQRDIESNQLPDPASLRPILKKIATNPNLLDIARQRAKSISDSLHPGQ
jgi:hypothetical protein